LPVTERRAFSYELHGRRIDDPYHWLEGSAAPEVQGGDPALDVAVAAWTDAQNAYSRAVLDALPGRAAVSVELERWLSLDSWGIPRQRGDSLFYTVRRGSAAQPVLYAERAGDATPTELVNVNSLDPSGRLALAWFRPSPDGRYVAVGTYSDGDEDSRCRVLEVATREWLGDALSGRVDPVAWFDDSRRFVARRLRDAADPYSGQIVLHELGGDGSAAAVLFEQYRDGPLATTWGPAPIVDPSGRWLVVTYYTGTDTNDVWCYDLERWRTTGEFVRRDLLVGEPALTSGFVAGDTFFAATTLGAPNKRVVAFDLAAERPERFRELVAERRDAVLLDIAPAPERIVAEYLVAGQSRVEILAADGRVQSTVAFPAIGTAALVTDRISTTTWASFESFGEPPAIYRVDVTTGATRLWRRPDAAGSGRPSLVARQVRYASRDGTSVPMFLVHRADLRLDGGNPTVLYGYGGFDIALTPTFLAGWQPWLERGGVYAIANLRGGGELGADWHRAGMLERKQNVFDDFYAAADWLVAQGFTRPDKLGIRGGSNGGLLTGTAVTQRPSLAAAAIVAVPLLDMLRYQFFLMARYWVPEYGSAENPSQFEYLRAYSPYQNVRPGTPYPAVLLTAGENDSRVHALHARKMAAALQAATASDPVQKPILLRVDRDVGHGPGKPLTLRIRDAADEVLFMANQLGLEIR
jgi:prolyl oligopeptidase